MSTILDMETEWGQGQMGEVVVIGAGPTGLVAAIRLAERGICVTIVDAATEPAQESRAALIHAASIEVLDRIGVGDALLGRARHIDAITISDGPRMLGRVPFQSLRSQFPFALGLPQSETEALLIDRLEQLGVVVQRGHKVTTVTQDSDGCEVTGTDVDTGAPWTRHCRYVIAADGNHSVIREQLGIEFLGDRYAEDFVLADVALHPQPTPPEEARLCVSPEGVTVLGLFPSGRYRIIATSIRGRSTPASPDRDYLDELLSTRGIDARTADDPVWSSRFRISHQVASRFRIGNVALCGDAAHVHSPAAGQGMNTGIADAYDLAERIADACHGDESGLDCYEQERRPIALDVIRFTDRMTTMALARSPLIRVLRNTALRLATRIPPIRHRIVTWVSGIERSPLRHSSASTRAERWKVSRE